MNTHPLIFPGFFNMMKGNAAATPSAEVKGMRAEGGTRPHTPKNIPQCALVYLLYQPATYSQARPQSPC